MANLSFWFSTLRPHTVIVIFGSIVVSPPAVAVATVGVGMIVAPSLKLGWVGVDVDIGVGVIELVSAPLDEIRP